MTDYDEKSKRKNDERDVEWSFDFAQIGESMRGLFDSLAGEEEVKHTTFSVDKMGVESARVHINFSVGKNTLAAITTPTDDLLQADLKYVGEIEWGEEGETTKTVHIKQKSAPKDITSPIKQGLRAMANSNEIEWQVNLSPDVLMSLDINGGVGPTRLDLANLRVRNAKLDAGVGEFTIILPQQQEEIALDINTGVGETNIYIPDDCNANLDIEAGVGQVNITVPPNAAVQVRGNNGIGTIKVPASLRRLTKKEFMENKGLWQSEGFDLAERRIIIRYKGGIGALDVREATL